MAAKIRDKNAKKQLRQERQDSIHQVIDGCEKIQSMYSDDGPSDVPQPKTILEALEQRLDKYLSGLESAEAEGDKSKERRMKRLFKQYEDAIEAFKAGKQVNFSELPTPPGYPPIPVGGRHSPRGRRPQRSTSSKIGNR